MISFNRDASGGKLRVNFNRDVSTATAFTMTLEPEAGADSREVSPVTLGTSDVEVGDETFSANEYVEYTIAAGDFDDYTGRWRVKASATLAASVVSTDFILFRVTA